jgi:SAM-dependent methyltransferase
MKRDAMHFFFPETSFGGFSSVDGTIQFYTRVQALISQNSVVLDLGAGRGASNYVDKSPYRKKLQQLKGMCKQVIGIDVDPVVLQNPTLDQAFVIGSDGVFPLDDQSIDLIVCDHTLEHVANPEQFASEVSRVLKSGGVFCARTPNRFGYIGLGTNLIPNSWHVMLLRYLQPNRLEEDVFPTRYLLNTRRAISRFFSERHWEHAMYTWNAEPAYFGNSKIVWTIVLLLFRFLPPFLGSTWNIFLRKR